MEVILRPTDKVVMLQDDATGVDIPARIWQGKTSTGIPVHAYITRIAVAEDRPDHELEEFSDALKETEKLRPDVASIPMRLIL